MGTGGFGFGVNCSLMADSDTAIASSSSQLSIGFPERVPSLSSKLNFSPYTGPLTSDKHVLTTNQCCIGLYCVTHQKLLLATLKSKGLFLPNFPLKSSDSWLDLGTRSVQHLFETQKLPRSVTLVEEHLVEILRIQLPKKYPGFLLRLTFVASIDHELSKESAGDCVSQPDDLYRWSSIEEIKQSDQLWGIEPLEIFSLIKFYSEKVKSKEIDQLDNPLPITINEYDTLDATRHIISMDPLHLKEKELLLSAKFTFEEVQKLYNEFAIQCFPSQYMTYASFKIFMNKIGWVNEEEILYKMVFRSYTSAIEKPKIFHYLTFDELIIGLAAMEERADHRGNCLLLRLRYIFNFYDSDEDGRLNIEELTQMVADIKKKPTEPVPQVSSMETNKESQVQPQPVQSSNLINQDAVVAEFLRRVANQPVTSDSYITLTQLHASIEMDAHLTWVAEMTETLFRSNISTIDVASVKFDYRVVFEQLTALKVHSLDDRYDEPCDTCHFSTFRLCSHAIKIDERGLLRGTLKFDVCPFYRDTPFVQELKTSEEEFALIINELHRLSLVAIGVYANIAYKEDPVIRPAKDSSLISTIKQVLKMAKETIRPEPLVMNIVSPCMVAGDLWSNIPNLHTLITAICRMAPFVNPITIIFAGNFIDPQLEFGVETIVYLLCFKILMPNRIILLRGRNEFRTVLQKSKFHQDCIEHFNEDIFKLICDICELLPVVAIIDERIYVSSSGFPLLNSRIDKNKVLTQIKKRPTKINQATDITNIV